MYEIELEIVNDGGYIETFHYNNVTYVNFKFYNVSIFLNDTKTMLFFQNVLSINLIKK